MTAKDIRSTIKNDAAQHGVKCRITASGEVHYFGRMPNSIKTGWYFVAWNAADYAESLRAA